jgi:type I restriction enzyme S subunit
MKQYIPLGDLLESSDSGVWGDEDLDAGISVLRSTNFNADGTLDLTRLTYRALEARDQSRKLLRSGDILLEKSGGGPKQPVGRVCLFRGDAAPHAFGNFIARLRPRQVVLSEYLFYYLWQFHSSGKTSHYQKQTTGIRNLEFKRYLTIPVPVCPIEGQQRIVDLLSRAEGIVRLRRQAQQKAAELIPAIFVDMFGDTATNPKGWHTRRLRDLVEFQSGGTPSKARDDYWQGDVPWVSPKDMKRLALYDAIDHISDLVLVETGLKLVPAGSVLIVVRGMILAHTVPVAEARVPLTVNQDMKALIPKGAIRSTYLLWMLQVCHDRLLAQVTTAAHGTKKLDTARLEEMTIPLPPASMQLAFETNVRRIEAIQEHQVNAAAKADAAFSALLARAFVAEGAGAAVREAEEVGS